jgi:tetratricopeptide (TPR) repeat protein
MSKRLAYLEKVAAEGKADSFALYALALEYKSLERFADATSTFERLKASDPAYLPMYLMCGTIHADALHDAAAARAWLEEGVALARSKGDGKTLGELEDALSRVKG